VVDYADPYTKSMLQPVQQRGLFVVTPDAFYVMGKLLDSVLGAEGAQDKLQLGKIRLVRLTELQVSSSHGVARPHLSLVHVWLTFVRGNAGAGGGGCQGAWGGGRGPCLGLYPGEGPARGVPRVGRQCDRTVRGLGGLAAVCTPGWMDGRTYCRERVGLCTGRSRVSC
jgi:hypothetical protein